MKKGWVVYDRNQYQKNRWFADRLHSIGSGFSDMRMVIAEDLSYGISAGKPTLKLQGEPVELPDFAVIRTISPFLSSFLEKAGIRLFNRAEIARICNDKRETCLLMRQTVPMAETRFCEKRYFDVRTMEKGDFPLVVKSHDGHGGSGVFLAEEEKELSGILGEIDGNAFVMQRFLPPGGRDLRVYCLGGEILGSVLRTSEGWKSNFSLGGKAELYTTDQKERELIRSLIGRFPVLPDFIGLDFLVTEKGLLFNEAEDVVGCRMLYECTELDAAAEYMDYIRKTLEKELP